VTTIKLCLAYDGTTFAGWQRQRDDRSVQGVLEAAIAEVVGRPVTVVGAGRTDRGVHALGQVATFETDSAIPPERFPLALNCHLPDTVRVYEAEAVSAGFHPCLSATGKHYRYTIWCGRIAPALWSRFVAVVHHDLQWPPMVEAAGAMLGRRDFRAFRNAAKGQEGISTVKDVAQILLRRFDRWLVVDVVGSGFLYKQVRTMVGTLLEVGRGRIPPRQVAAILKAGDRRRAGPTPPAAGLCLMQVFYAAVPPSWFEAPGPVVWQAHWRSAHLDAARGPDADGEAFPARGSSSGSR
jgi:tRNA pseudouridine38-40 synthase